MSDLLSITESAVRALDRHPSAPFQVPPRVQTTPVLGLYNAFRDYDSDASGSALGSVDSHSTSAGSVLINSTSNVDVYQEPLINMNREPVQIYSKDRLIAVGTRSKPVRLSAKSLREVSRLEVLGRKGTSLSGSSERSIHLVKPSGVKVVPEKSVKSQMGNEMKTLGGEEAPGIHPRMNGSSSTGSLESAEEERRRWMVLDESYRHHPTNSGSPEEQNSDGKYNLSASGKDIRAVLPLRDSGYLTQGIHTIRATATMGVTEAVADMEDSNSTASRESAIVIHGREESDLSNRESECSTQPSIVNVPQTIVNVRSTASTVSSLVAESSGGTSDSERSPSMPFVALKDRFLKFRPILLKQGTLTNEAMFTDSKEMSDELHIEQFVLNEKQQRLRNDFLNQQTGNAAIRKCVPARIIVSGSSESGDARKAPESSVTSSSAAIPDFVASAAVAAVVATQAIMKSQQQEILNKIDEIESKKLLSESGKLSHDERITEEANRRKLETLETQLTSLTQKRLGELERHLERQEKQQLDVQAQLHAMVRRLPSAYDGRYQAHDQRHTDERSDDGRSWVRFTDGHPDMSIMQDMEREKMSVLETPAPRQKRPMPTMYERTSDRVNEDMKQFSATDVNRAGNPFLAHVIASHDKEMMGRPKTSQSPINPLTAFDHQFNNISQNARALPQELNVMKDVPLTPVRPPPPSVEPAPLGKYLRKPMLETSPYPEIRGFGESRLASLVQYAEAEAVLKHVHADCDILKANLDMIERSRQDHEIYSTMARSIHDRPFSDKIQIKRMVGQRINVLNRQIEAEVAVELIKQEKLNEAKKFMYPEKDNVVMGKRLSGRPVAGRPRSTGPAMAKFVALEKENLPKTTKPRAIKKPRPLNPVEDENLLQRIYGKTLYHKLRSSQMQNGQCSHDSPKSKLPRTPVHIPHIQVQGVEMASAKTQTKFARQPAAPGQYVQGLQGQLIPMAIPLSLHKMDEHVSRINESLRQRSPKRKAHVTLKMPKQLHPESVLQADVDHFSMVMEEGAEEEEQESTMTEEGQVISLPGHTSPPTAYHGPKFPVRIPTMQPSPSSEVLAADIRRTDLLQKEAIGWVEQELMARMISEMYSKRSEERKDVQQCNQRPPDTVEQDSSIAEDESRDGSVHDSVVVDTIGQHGVQLFVDAGHPISGDLVSALIREVLAEKIGSMFGPERGSNVQSSTGAMAEPRLPSSAPAVVIPVTDNYYTPQEHPRPLIPTPEPTPEPSSTHSPVHLDSLPSTPRRTPDAEPKVFPVAIYGQEQKEEEEDEEEDVSFPTYEGMSNSESQKTNVDEFAGPSGVNIATPDITPVPSPPPVVRTPSPSAAESIPPEPTKETKATQADLALPIEVPVVTVATEEPVEEEERSESELSLKHEKLPPKSEASSPDPTSNMSPNDDESVELPTEVSTTNNENISEGQWLITLLSEGEIPDIHLNEALRQRVRQHMINASRLHRHSMDEDTFADDIEQDLVSEVLPSEGELQAPQCRLSDQEVIVRVVTRPKSLATYGLLTSDSAAEGLRVSRSIGELRIGADFGELLDHGIIGPSQKKMHDMSISKGSSFDENHVSLGEYQFDQASGKVYSNQPNRRLSDTKLVSSSAINRGPASPVGKAHSDERLGDRVSTKTVSSTRMKEGGTVSPPGTVEMSQNRQITSLPVHRSSERAAGVVTNGTRAGPRGRVQVGAGPVMSTQEAGKRVQGRRPQFTFSEGHRRPKSPPQKSLPGDIMRQSYETDFSQTGSQLTGDFRDSRTPDQMNLDTLIQSHDYFNQSEFGSTGQSLLDAGTLKDKPMFQSTYSLVRSVDTEQGASARSSFQPEQTETMGSEQLSKRLKDSLEGTGASQDNLEYSEEGRRSEEVKYQMPVKIPSISTYEEGTESDVSEISLTQQSP